MAASGFAFRFGIVGESRRLLNFLWAFLRHLTVRRLGNLVRVEFERLIGRDRVRGYPYVLKVYPTNKCNLRCPLCHTGSGTRMWKVGLAAGENPSGAMDETLFRQVIDELGPYCFQVLLYGWGEPFLLPGIYGMISYAAEKGVGVSVTSNMTVLKPGDAERIVESGLEHLTVSIDGATAETYGVYRVGGDFARATENLRAVIEARRRLKRRRPVIEWQFIVMRHNEHEMADARRLAAEWGVDVFRFTAVGIDPSSDEQFEKWLPADERRSMYDYRTRQEKHKKKPRRCAWLYRAGVINWDGSVSPCCHYNEDIRSYFGVMGPGAGFSDVWNNESFVFSRILTNRGRQAAIPLMNSRTKENICLRCRLIRIRE